jgi:hypothetical protein
VNRKRLQKKRKEDEEGEGRYRDDYERRKKRVLSSETSRNYPKLREFFTK